MNLALKDLRHQLVRFTLICTLVGLLLGTVLAQVGVYRGVVEDAYVLIDAAHAQLWVVQAERFAPFAESSVLPDDVRDAIGRLPGIAATGGLIYDAGNMRHGGRITRVTFAGYEPGRPGAPPPVIEGRGIFPRRAELVADVSSRVEVGEVVGIRGEEFTVVGLVEGMVSAVGDPVVFLELRNAQRLQYRLGGAADRRREAGGVAPPSSTAVSAIAVAVSADADIDAVVRGVRRWKHLSAVSHADFADYMSNAVISKIRQQIAVFSSLLILVVLVVITLAIYLMTTEKLKALAILKLIGADNGVVVEMIVQQALVLGVAGLTFGHLMVFAVRDFFPRRMVLHGADMLALAGVTLLVCLLASIAGVRLALRVEPTRALAD